MVVMVHIQRTLIESELCVAASSNNPVVVVPTPEAMDIWISTRPQDWEPGARAIVFPNGELTTAQVKQRLAAITGQRVK